MKIEIKIVYEKEGSSYQAVAYIGESCCMVGSSEKSFEEAENRLIERLQVKAKKEENPNPKILICETNELA